MTPYALPAPPSRPAAEPNTAYLIASGDLRPKANLAGWPTQVQMEADVTAAFAEFGWTVRRANPVDPATGHGFISSQRMGLEVFKSIPADAPLIVAEAVWQYSHHVLAGLRTHRGPILTVANFAGTWPGLVGLLGLNAGMAKMGVAYSTIWSVDFTDDWFKAGLRSWTSTWQIPHDQSHVRPLPRSRHPRSWTSVRRSPASSSPTRPSSASSTRAAWACTTRSSTTSCSTRSASTRSGSPRAPCGPRCSPSPTTRPTPSGSGCWAPA